ncbi:MAG: hypothetical protein ACM3U2_24030 [Deltaproteobacteria bacterium]
MSDQSGHSFDLAVARLVPREWWKYVVGGLTGLAIAAGLVTAGACASDLSATLGPGIERLFAFPDAPVARWFSSLLLSVSAQSALFIWWARSQSDKDFDGRYWLWIRVAWALLLFGGCVAIGAHAALRTTLRYFLPEISGRTATLGWLLPASLAGVATLLSLAREMRGCRWSRTLILLGSVAYVTAAGLHLELDVLIAPATRLLSLQASLLAGHLAVFLSMWLHARHVLYCTVDPAAPPKSRWRIPRPHFRLPRLGWNRRRPTEPEAAASPPSRRKRPAGVAELPPSGGAALERGSRHAPPSKRTETAGKPHLRIDTRRESVPANPEESPSSVTTAGPTGRGSTTISNSGSGSPPPREAAPQAVPAAASDPRERSSGARDEAESSAGEADEVPSKPDLRGLSKKQRRRLMQELRERERTAGR